MKFSNERSGRGWQFAEVFEAEYARVVGVGEVKVQSVAADNGDMGEAQIVGDGVCFDHFFARPLVYAARARTCPAKLSSLIASFGAVGPRDRDGTVGFFDYLGGFGH